MNLDEAVRVLREELEISGDQLGDVAQVPGPALAAVLAALKPLRAMERRARELCETRTDDPVENAARHILGEA